MVKRRVMAEETVRSRIRKNLTGETPTDRLPMVEWATWWNLTIERWQTEGLPTDLDKAGIKRYFGLDVEHQQWIPSMLPGAEPLRKERRWIDDEADYETLLPFLYPDPPVYDRDMWRGYAAEQAAGSAAVWITLEGFFWWPRVLLGIEPHLYSFYDKPELMLRINEDLAGYLLRCVEDFCSNACVPDFMTFAEDMSYNHGPMISKDLFDEFMAPFYRRVVPRIKERGIVPLVDSDGDIEPLIPWLEDVGIEGIAPLERMAGVDVNRIRRNHPDWRMVGGFDKTVMHLGEHAMRWEFERLMPAMRSGRFIPSVDHQTPPAVSIEDYRLYVRLLREYATKAVSG